LHFATNIQQELHEIKKLKKEKEESMCTIELMKDSLGLRIVPQDENLNVFDIQMDGKTLA
jgi:hypothetical protein